MELNILNGCFTREANFMVSYLISCEPIPFQKRMNFLPFGANSYLLKQTAIQRKCESRFEGVVSTLHLTDDIRIISVLMPQNIWIGVL